MCRTKKSIFIMMFIGLFFTLNISDVYAGVTCKTDLKDIKYIVEGSTETEEGMDKACNGARYCYSTMATQGLRFAIVDKNGKRVDGTKLKDYWFKRYSINDDGTASYDHELDFTVQDRGYKLSDYTIYKASNGKETLIQEYRDLDKVGEFEKVTGQSALQTIRDNSEDISSFLKGILECKVDGKPFTFSFGAEYRNSKTVLNAYDSNSYDAVVKILLDYGNSNTYLEDLYNILDPNGKADLSTSFIQVEPLYQFSYRDTKENKVYNYMGSYAEVWYMTHYHPTNDVPAATATPNAYAVLDGMWLMTWRSYGKNADGSPNEYEAIFSSQDSNDIVEKNMFTDDFVLYAFNNALHPKKNAVRGTDIPQNFYAKYNTLTYTGTVEQDTSVRDYARTYYNVDTTNQGHVVGGWSATYKEIGGVKIQQDVPAIAVSFIKLSQLFNCNDTAMKFDKTFSKSSISDLSKFLSYIKTKKWDSKEFNSTGAAKIKNINDAFSFLYNAFADKKTKFEIGNGETANNFIFYKTFNYYPTSDKTKINYCGLMKCDDALNILKKNGKLNETNLKKLSTLYYSFEKIDPDYLKNFYGDILDEESTINYLDFATCKSAPKCGVGKVDATCSKTGTGKSFTISDFTYQGLSETSMSSVSVNTAAEFSTLSKQDCLKDGIAYNYYKDGTTTEKVKSQNAFETNYYGHIDLSATTAEGRYATAARCWESSTFSFPGSVKNIEAGTIFMWGMDNTKETVEKNKFGTMTIKRYCTVPDYYLPSGSSQRIISSIWAIPEDSPITADKLKRSGKDVVNTNIKIHYQQAVPNGVSIPNYNVDVDTKIQLGRLKTELYSKNYNNYKDNIDQYNDVYFSCGQYGWEENPTFADGKSKCADKWEISNDPFTITCYSDSSDKDTKCSKLGDASNPPIIYVEATYDILYQDKFKWYSDKSENFTKKMKTNISDSVDNAKYVSLGYGLPTSFVTPPLPKNEDYYYGYSISSTNDGGYMYAEISNIGTKKGGSYHFDKLTVKITDDDTLGSSDNIIYSCGFNIQNKLYCFECDSTVITKNCKDGVCTPPAGSTPKDIDVVFRTVELVDATDNKKDEENINKIFPGRSGKGREIGSNWKKILGSEQSDSSIVNYFSSNVYKREPKYAIDLSSKNIQDIRKENTKESYTNMDNYEFYKGYLADKSWDASDASTFSAECVNEGDSTKCFKASLALHGYADASTGKESGYIYTRAGSPFLSDLISKGQLIGTCAKESDTKKRTELYAKELGC